MEKEYIEKEPLVNEIQRRIKLVERRLYINNSYTEEGNIAWERDQALYDNYNFFLSFIDELTVIKK